MTRTILSALFVLTLFNFCSAQIAFTDQTSALSNPTHFSGNAVTVQDINGDGLDDIVLLDQARNLMIEFQQADGSWISYTGGEMDDQQAWGMVVADLDNNGWGDIISGVNGDNPDYAKANADGTDWVITDLTGYSLFYQGSSMADIDQDGDIDLFVCADTDNSAIWENDGTGGLTHSQSMIDLSTEGWDGSGNYGSTFTDFDLDGDLDLYVAHCRQGVNDETDPRRINQLFENDGNNNYTENAAAYGLNQGAQTWTADFGDIDNDGDFDIIQTNHNVNNMLLENLDDSNQYEDIFSTAIVTQDVGFPIQALFKDFDNDGFLDLIVTGGNHALYHNNGDKTFTLVPDAFDGPDMLSLAVGDMNHDGFLDVYGSYAEIYNNPSNTPDRVWINEGNSNNFITVVLEGTISNQDAVGSVVRVYGEWGVQVREVRAGESYGINNSFHTHFGLGEETMIDSLVIDWPSSGIHQVIISPEANQFLTVVENECVAPTAAIITSGSPILCSGESLVLEADDTVGLTYLWSNGAVTSSITVTEAGVYMVEVTDSEGNCSALSASLEVLLSPDETPSINAAGALTFCEGGAVELTSSSAEAYTWNTTEATQSIMVTESGDYFVTVTGACEDWASETLSIVVEPSPTIVPAEVEVFVPGGTTADLVATTSGEEVRWYDLQIDGTLLSAGETFTTPEIIAETSFWTEGVSITGGESGSGGKDANSNGEYFDGNDRYLYFDAYQEFIVDAVKVYNNSAGNKEISLYNSDGTVLEAITVSVPGGESIVPIGITVPVGEGFTLRVTGAANMWRDNDDAAVNYPYALSTFGSITGANVGADVADQYYYYFYDWQVSLPTTECVSERVEVTVYAALSVEEFGSLASVLVYPNPTQDLLNILFEEAPDSKVNVELTDISGKTIFTSEWNSISAGASKQIDLSSFNPGIYLLSLTSDNGRKTRRIEIR